MDVLVSSAALVFVAELGDKTQLVALGFGARHRLAPVLVGVVLAYMATNLLSVVVGGLLGAALPTRAVGIGGGVLFLGFAAYTLFTGDEHDHDHDAPASALTGRVVFTVATAMFVAELGDKTMLATATLAARGSPILVWIGATIGIVASGALGVIVGRMAGAHIPERAIRIVSGALFAVFGVVLLVNSI